MKTTLSTIKNQLMIVLAVLAAAVFTGCKEDTPAPNTVTDIVLTNNDFSILRAAVSRAGLADALKTGTLTVFAPNDAAFTASGLSLNTVNTLDVNTLKAVLQYHVLGTTILSSAIPTANNTEVTTLTGSKAYVTKNTALEGLLQAALDKGLAVDAVVSASLAQADALWTLREGISEAQSAEGASIKHDIAVPISRIADFIEAGQRALLAISPSARPMTFGHLGDGNLHFNVSAPAGADKAAFMALQPAMNLAIHDLVAAYDGSISAEHGLGLLRRDEAIRYRSPLETQLMRTLKTALDPENLMNPGKVLP